jgi:glycerol-3-phosphate acyltransferase PlsY
MRYLDPALWGGSGSELVALRELILMLVGGLVSRPGGHSFTCWLGFKGGKGVATTGGVFPGCGAEAGSDLFGDFCYSGRLTRYVSLASITAAICLPVWSIIYHRDIFLTPLAAPGGTARDLPPPQQYPAPPEGRNSKSEITKSK